MSLSGKPIEDLRPPAAKKLCADFAGFSLHAAVRVPAGEVHRSRLERLARYVCRPPLAKDRLSRTRSGHVVYKFKKPWRNGSEAVVMDPLTFLSRLKDRKNKRCFRRPSEEARRQDPRRCCPTLTAVNPRAARMS